MILIGVLVVVEDGVVVNNFFKVDLVSQFLIFLADIFTQSSANFSFSNLVFFKKSIYFWQFDRFSN